MACQKHVTSWVVFFKSRGGRHWWTAWSRLKDAVIYADSLAERGHKTRVHWGFHTPCAYRGQSEQWEALQCKPEST